MLVSFERNGDRKFRLLIQGLFHRNLTEYFDSYCGFIVKKTIPNDNRPANVLFRAIDRRIPAIRIKTAQAQNLMGKRIVVSIDSWPITSA